METQTIGGKLITGIGGYGFGKVMMQHGNMSVTTQSGMGLLKGRTTGRFKAKSMFWNGGKLLARQEPRPPII
jgi:hypothetical protein